jgi:3-phenylpropionate/cinnamic acid dioxygenase small subunit
MAGPGEAAGNRGALVDVHEHYEVAGFLDYEAELLDEQRYGEWLGLLTDDVRYRMPVRPTTMRHAGGPTPGRIDHFDEDRYGLGKRVERLGGKHAWTEDPPSRTRRFVTNVRAWSGGEGELEVRSYILLFRSRLDVRPPEFVSASRQDRLRRHNGQLRIASRLINVDEAVLRTQNLAVLL